MDRIADGHPQSQLDELLPGNWQEAKSPLKVNPDGPGYIEQDYRLELLMKIPKIAVQVSCGKDRQARGLSGGSTKFESKKLVAGNIRAGIRVTRVKDGYIKSISSGKLSFTFYHEL